MKNLRIAVIAGALILAGAVGAAETTKTNPSQEDARVADAKVVGEPYQDFRNCTPSERADELATQARALKLPAEDRGPLLNAKKACAPDLAPKLAPAKADERDRQ